MTLTLNIVLKSPTLDDRNVQAAAPITVMFMEMYEHLFYGSMKRSTVISKHQFIIWKWNVHHFKTAWITYLMIFEECRVFEFVPNVNESC